MSSVVADTHTVIWYLCNSKLSTVAGEMLDRTIQSGSSVYISAISLVELVYLIQLPHPSLRL
jgi:PIN domain nuclease of toxin-antitoxin system